MSKINIQDTDKVKRLGHWPDEGTSNLQAACPQTELTVRDARGARGCLLWNPITGKHFFRIYDDKNFKDYDLAAEEIWVNIESGDLEFNDGEGKLNWSRKVLGLERDE